MPVITELMQKIITVLNPNLDKTLAESVLLRLDSFGYALKETDAWMIGFSIEKVQNKVKNECNINSIPEGLFHVAVDMICGEFLLAKKETGQLDMLDINMDLAIKQIQEGDTNITYAIGDACMTPEQRLNSFIKHLLVNGEDEFITYRCLKW